MLWVLFLVFSVIHAVDFPTPLQQYVWKPDSTYRYELYDEEYGADTTTYNIHMFSQTWLSPQDTTISVWDHWLKVVVPNNVRTSVPPIRSSSSAFVSSSSSLPSLVHQHKHTNRNICRRKRAVSNASKRRRFSR